MINMISWSKPGDTRIGLERLRTGLVEAHPPHKHAAQFLGDGRGNSSTASPQALMNEAPPPP